MFQRLELHNFKAFERFSLRVRGDAYLAGPNNAGKSTIIAALRAGAYMLRTAQRQRPVDRIHDGAVEALGYYFDSSQVALNDENLPHEFREVESRIVMHFARNRRLTAVWPSRDDDDPFFYLQAEGNAVQSAREATADFPQMGVIPILSPVDQHESVLTARYVRQNVDGRLASRHFRNQLRLLDEDGADEESFEAFLEFAEPWIGEIELRDLVTHRGERDVEFDLSTSSPGAEARRRSSGQATGSRSGSRFCSTSSDFGGQML